MSKLVVKESARKGEGRLSWEVGIVKPTLLEKLLGRKTKTVSCQFSAKYKLYDDAVAGIPMSSNMKSMIAGLILSGSHNGAIFRIYKSEEIGFVLALSTVDGWDMLGWW